MALAVLLEYMITKKIAVPMAAMALVLSAGGGIVAAAHADTGSTSASTLASSSSTTAQTGANGQPESDPSQGGHVGKNGVKEAVLTGDAATKATAAALAAVPGGTIQRVENDAEGAVYEAHMTKSDGSHVTVKLDSNFVVTSTEAGHGGHGFGHGRPNDNDADDAGATTQTTATTSN